MDMLALVGMQAMAERPAARLSGGQPQRVALARAVVRRPALLLLGEPLSNLDARLRETMRNELAEMIARVSVTALFVTHDQAEAFALADHVTVMDRGRIVQEGALREIYAKPRASFIAAFLGAANLIDARIESKEGGGHARFVLDTPSRTFSPARSSASAFLAAWSSTASTSTACTCEGSGAPGERADAEPARVVEGRRRALRSFPERVICALASARSAWLFHRAIKPDPRCVSVRSSTVQDLFEQPAWSVAWQASTRRTLGPSASCVDVASSTDASASASPARLRWSYIGAVTLNPERDCICKMHSQGLRYAAVGDTNEVSAP